jgi:hypothetical protein
MGRDDIPIFAKENINHTTVDEIEGSVFKDSEIFYYMIVKKYYTI